MKLTNIVPVTLYESRYNLYRMEVTGGISVETVIEEFNKLENQYKENQMSIDEAATKAIAAALGIDVDRNIDFSPFGCTAFSKKDDNSHWMGRNYDFKTDTSCMMVYYEPKDSTKYKSVAFAALNNLGITNPLIQQENKMLQMAPFVCLDGINERGVSIAVLVVDGEPTCQFEKGKQDIFTTLALRYVLDNANSTAHAISLLLRYNMFATGGKDYHFYICDKTGTCVTVEYTYDNRDIRILSTTSTNIITNFYIYDEKHYGHGYDRYISVHKVLGKPIAKYTDTNERLWEALIKSSQEPVEGDLTSNTQWSILYSNSDLTAEIVFRRNWENKFKYNLNTNTIEEMLPPDKDA